MLKGSPNSLALSRVYLIPLITSVVLENVPKPLLPSFTAIIVASVAIPFSLPLDCLPFPQATPATAVPCPTLSVKADKVMGVSLDKAAFISSFF